jgi:peptidoglycan/xylan/chitin deacetylase (PgdA/CDA1 family)
MDIPILMYHAFGLDRSPITLPPLVFSQQMQWLHDHGYQTLSLLRLAEHILTGVSLPERSVVLTFDDGYQSVYQVALPVLIQYGFNATVFLVAGHCGGYNDWDGQPAGIPHLPLLDWQQVQEMDQAGIDFGAHTVSHARLDKLSMEKVRQEILDSRQIITDKLGHAVNSFAYPYGRYDQQVKGLVRETFLTACSARLGLVSSESDPYELKRIEVLYLQPWFLFKGLDQSWFPLYISFRRRLRQVASPLFRRPWN